MWYIVISVRVMVTYRKTAGGQIHIVNTVGIYTSQGNAWKKLLVVSIAHTAIMSLALNMRLNMKLIVLAVKFSKPQGKKWLPGMNRIGVMLDQHKYCILILMD